MFLPYLTNDGFVLYLKSRSAVQYNASICLIKRFAYNYRKSNMLKYEELKAKDLVREAIVLEPSKTLYDARNILLRYNIKSRNRQR